MKDKFLIIDGSSLIHRAFYAWPLLTNKAGEFTNAVYGLAVMLNKVLETEKPRKVVICFDKSRITFRTNIFADYKGNRGETPEELKPQFELAKVLVDNMGIAWEEIENYEADDIIGTLARLGSQKNDVVILTGDRDSFQLINDNAIVMLTKKGITSTEVWDKKKLMEHYGLNPQQMIDLKSLMGDASDNIPGISGIGEKTALKLLKEYGSLDNVLANAENIKAKGLRTKVLSGKDSAVLSYKLAVIDQYMNEKYPQLADLERYNYENIPLAENKNLINFYKNMNFNSLLKTADLKPKKGIFDDVQIIADSSAEKVSSDELFSSLSEKNSVKTDIDFNKLTDDLKIVGSFAMCVYKNFLAIFYSKNNKNNIIVAPLVSFAKNADFVEILEDENITKTTYQGKKLIVIFGRKGICLKGIKNDIELMAYLLDPTAGSYEPHKLAVEYMRQQDIVEKEYSEEEIATLNVRLIPGLYESLLNKLKENQLFDLYENLELPLSFVLADMEIEGITVDKEVLRNIDIELSAAEADLTSQIYDLAGRSFNINSPKQLGEILFVEMGIPPVKKTKTGFSTNQEVLETLTADYPIASLILQYRTVSKLRSTYAVGLQALIEDDGKIHTSFNQTVTATGRLSSADPNLQNIPIREEMGRKLRKAFKPQSGNLLVSADYSQIELRVLADISGDKVLQESFIKGEDIHARTAAEVFGVDIKDVNREQRRRAKAVNFGIVYGISDYGLSRDLGITRAESKEYIEKYLAGYDGVRFYMKDIVEQGKKKGYVETLLGRKRWLPDLRNRNYNLRSFAERTALNTPIQGTAADIMKIAMLNISAKLKNSNLKTKMLLQVHDELIFDVPKDEIKDVVSIIKDGMENAYDLAVPMTVDVKMGTNWYDMEPMGED